MFFGHMMKMARFYVEADDNGVFVYSPPFGKYAVRWDETDTLETNGTGFVLHGEGKSLGFNTMMANSSVSELLELMDRQNASKGIVVKRVNHMPRAKPTNTRVG